ncbi:MAG: 3-phosphoserine/phosphohydroxythreonine transaminase [Candidatus Omnitrophica bacterium]|nr:3-phosphoserine/phosphohydroxythreonine transaminase [Candidatus Omnitrophota bacterium]
MSNRVYNFSAGPATLPLSVLEKTQKDLVCLPGVGASILEISHRSKAFTEIIQTADANLRELLDIPGNYKILFLHGGASLQFSMVPMNLLREKSAPADYILTGTWGDKAIKEARKEGQTRIAWDGADENYKRIPKANELELDPEATYVHITTNETIQGVQWQSEPDTGKVPLVCDASSDFLSRPIDVRKYGLIYACAQKNAGPAGVTVVILREDLLEQIPAGLPSMLDYSVHVKNDSVYNTAPVFPIYVLKLVTDWLKDEVGGISKIALINEKKSQMLYEVIDQSDGFYIGHAEPECRSKVNVTWRFSDNDLQAQFLEGALAEGLTDLKGHRSVGGIRASIYNAMPAEGVEKLRDFMIAFAKRSVEKV